MAIIKIDWKPSQEKIRVFGRNLALFAVLLAALGLARGQRERAAWTLAGGVALGGLTWLLPVIGRLVYLGWMSVAFVIGTCMSSILLAVFYYLVITPLGLLFRLRGRDALALRPGKRASYWMPLGTPEDKTYWERLY
jgi:hypothetical protein